MPYSDKIGTALDAATQDRYGIQTLKPGDETPGPDYYVPTSRYPEVPITGTPPVIIKREDGAIVTSGGTVLIPPPGQENPPTLPPLAKEPVTEGVTYGDPQRMVDYLARWSNFAPKPQAEPIPAKPNIYDLKTNQVLTNQAPRQPSNPWNGYVNYDPDEILAAAMRVMRGRGAGRSMMY